MVANPSAPSLLNLFGYISPGTQNVLSNPNTLQGLGNQLFSNEFISGMPIDLSNNVFDQQLSAIDQRIGGLYGYGLGYSLPGFNVGGGFGMPGLGSLLGLNLFSNPFSMNLPNPLALSGSGLGSGNTGLGGSILTSEEAKALEAFSNLLNSNGAPPSPLTQLNPLSSLGLNPLIGATPFSSMSLFGALNPLGIISTLLNGLFAKNPSARPNTENTPANAPVNADNAGNAENNNTQEPAIPPEEPVEPPVTPPSPTAFNLSFTDIQEGTASYDSTLLVYNAATGRVDVVAASSDANNSSMDMNNLSADAELDFIMLADGHRNSAIQQALDDTAAGRGRLELRDANGNTIRNGTNRLNGSVLYYVPNDGSESVRLETDNMFHSYGGGQNNPDGMNHFQATRHSDGSISIGIEDVMGGGDNDFEDLNFVISPGTNAQGFMDRVFNMMG